MSTFRWSAAADVIDAGRRIKAHEISDRGFAHALLHLLKITDPRVRATARNRPYVQA